MFNPLLSGVFLLVVLSFHGNGESVGAGAGTTLGSWRWNRFHYPWKLEVVLVMDLGLAAEGDRLWGWEGGRSALICCISLVVIVFTCHFFH